MESEKRLLPSEKRIPLETLKTLGAISGEGSLEVLESLVRMPQTCEVLSRFSKIFKRSFLKNNT